MTDNDDALDTKGAAAFLGVSVRTLHRMVHDAQIPSIMVRGRRTFSRALLVKWKEQRAAESISRKKKTRANVVALVTA